MVLQYFHSFLGSFFVLVNVRSSILVNIFTNVELNIQQLIVIFSQVILGKFIHLWFGARGIEFDWKYMLLCLDSNLILLQHIATATFIWMWARQHLSSRVTSFVSMALLMTSYKPLILEHLKVRVIKVRLKS